MKRFVKLVKHCDRVGMSAEEFVKSLYGEKPDWSDALAAWWIYKEDGGCKLTFNDFRAYIHDLLKSEGYTPSDLVWEVVNQSEKRPDII